MFPSPMPLLLLHAPAEGMHRPSVGEAHGRASGMEPAPLHATPGKAGVERLWCRWPPVRMSCPSGVTTPIVLT